MRKNLFGCCAAILAAVSSTGSIYAADEAEGSPPLYKYEATESFKVYETPDLTSKAVDTNDPQTVTVYETKGEDWALIDTYLGKRWAYFGHDVYLERYRVLYKEKGDKSGTEIEPQVVKLLERDGDWVKIDTWLGERWVNLSENYRAHVVNPYKAYSYENLLADSDRISKLYPDIVNVSSIGESVEGRDLKLIKLGRGDRKVFIVGALHAREYIATTYLMHSIDNYAYAYAGGESYDGFDVKALLNKVTFCIIPMSNPDGVNLVQNGVGEKNGSYVQGLPFNESAGLGYGAKYGYRSWKANINGVDLNRNFEHGWENYPANYPRGSAGFKGDSAASEPETRAVQAYMGMEPFVGFLSIHSQGNIYYFYEDRANPLGFNRALSAHTGLRPANANSASTGSIGEPGGSFADYVVGKFGKMSLTIELCNYVGPYPYPDSGFDSVWRVAKNVMLLYADALQ